MAHTPSSRPPNACEGRIYDLLKQLDENCIFYYEPRPAGRRPDFVVIMPDKGVLVIEVKGWKAGTIREARSNRVLIAGDHEDVWVDHPEEQARRYADGISDRLRQNSHAHLIMQKEGKHKGGSCLPVSRIAVYGNISRMQFDNLGISECFPHDVNVTRDQILAWQKLEAAELETRFAAYMHFKPTQRLTSQ